MKRHRGRNEGSISQRRNGAWRAQVYQKGSRLSKDFRSKEQALTWIRTIQTQMDRGFLIRGSSITLSEYLAGWLDNRQLALREKTAYQYSSLIRNHIVPHIGETKIRDLRLSGIEEFYSQLVERGVGPRTVQIIHNVLHAALEKAIRHGLLAANPTHGATLPTYLHNEMRTLDSSQVSRFFLAARLCNETAFGYRIVSEHEDEGRSFGLHLNPEKSAEVRIEIGDKIIVFAD